LSDEYVMDMYMTKFPGGGLEYGEGPPDCLIRECHEEMDRKIRIKNHFYTTDFFQPTRFFAKTQLIGIYYEFELPKNKPLPASNKKFDFKSKENGAQSFRWVPFTSLRPEELTFPIDHKVAEMIIQNHQQSLPLFGKKK
jgi:8-oxo-dGTP diphosphatase